MPNQIIVLNNLYRKVRFKNKYKLKKYYITISINEIFNKED